MSVKIGKYEGNMSINYIINEGEAFFLTCTFTCTSSHTLFPEFHF